MWLHVPRCGSCRSRADLEDSTEESIELSFVQASRLGAWVTSRGRHLPPQYWQRAWLKRDWMKLLSTLTCDDSEVLDGVERWTSSLEAIHVSRTQLPEKDSELTTNETCGQKSLASLVRSRRRLFFAKMWELTPPLDSHASSKTWRGWVTACRRLSSKLVMSARRTSASGSSGSGWPTPTTAPEAENRGSNAKSHPPSLGVRAEQWPTPTTTDAASSANATATRSEGQGHHHAGTTLTDAMRTWSSPTSGNGHGNEKRDDGTLLLPGEARQWPTPDAYVSNDGEDPSTWRARQATLREKGVNGNGAGVPLAISAKEWPTPTASEAANRSKTEAPSVSDGRGHGRLLSVEARRAGWATPTTKEGDSIGPREMEVLATGENAGTTFESRLKLQAHAWATPTTQDSENDGPPSQFSRNSLPLNAQAISTSASSPSLPGPTTPTDGASTSEGTRVLNPRFVEALMSFPIGWTDCALSETPSSIYRRRLLSAFLLSATAAMPSPGSR